MGFWRIYIGGGHGGTGQTKKQNQKKPNKKTVFLLLFGFLSQISIEVV